MAGIRKILKNEFHLPIEQAVYVPSTSKESHKISPEQHRKRINEVRRYLSKKFGGFTSVNATGGWVNPKNKIIKENVNEVFSYSETKPYKKHQKELINQIRKWGKKWGQNSMGYQLEGDLYYIDTSKKRKK